jgi:hypothetical protein
MVPGGVFVKDSVPFCVDLYSREFLSTISSLSTPRQLTVSKIPHGFANEFVALHHYLRRKVYIAKNVSYGIFCGEVCVGVCMFGMPVWTTYPGLVPPMNPFECPELIRLCTLSNLPKNSESYFVSSCLKKMREDWKELTSMEPLCITSFCDIGVGFNGSIYKATNFALYKVTSGRPSNPGGSHGKWGGNEDKTKSTKHMYVYWYDRRHK